MSYTPTTWAAGDTVTAAKLNNMETGIANAVNAFIVNLTPTALDYSGTMDKTVAEIDAAYQAGKQIVFRVYSSLTEFIDAKLSTVYKDEATYPSFNAYIISADLNVLLFVATMTTDDGTKSTYSAFVFSLTPAT